ncbi:MAG TPA: hypothetical protein PK256_18140, partial [Verrucomicrobiota bacterium]|nr:hypothetical protein [Verrucomicrobiota bacterium]
MVIFRGVASGRRAGRGATRTQTPWPSRGAATGLSAGAAGSGAGETGTGGMGGALRSRPSSRRCRTTVGSHASSP